MNFYECCLFWFFWKDRNFLFYVHTFTCSSLISSATNFWINFVHVKPFLAWNLRCPEKKDMEKTIKRDGALEQKKKNSEIMFKSWSCFINPLCSVSLQAENIWIWRREDDQFSLLCYLKNPPWKIAVCIDSPMVYL